MLSRERHPLARRSFLACISALPAITLAGEALARHAASGEARLNAGVPDADVIAQAAAVTRLAEMVDRAYERLVRKSDSVMLAQRPRPIDPATQSGACVLDEHAVDPSSNVERCFTATFSKPSAGYQDAKRQHAEAMAVWEAEHDKLMHQAGARDASALCDALSDRLTDATDALAGMPATSPAGMAAKGDAFLAVMAKLQDAEDHQVQLARSLARDAVRVAGVSARRDAS